MSIVTIEESGILLVTAEAREFILNPKTETVTTQVDNSSIITLQEVSTVLVEKDSSTIILAGQPGPQGPTGLSEDELMFSKRVDFVDDNNIYRGEAAVGSTESAAVWRIRRIVLAQDGDVTETWAGGNADFNKQWSLRATYNYS